MSSAHHRRARTRAGLAVAAAAAATLATTAPAHAAACPDATTRAGDVCVSTDLQSAGGNARADFFTASRTCNDLGGRLPTPDELIGAAAKLRLAGRLDDDPATAAIDTDASRGLEDWRELTSLLVTTRSGSSSSGTLGSSEPATGDPATGEPNPAPQPADTAPATLQYITVIDNGNRGGFAGSAPVGDPERFRCVFTPGAGTAAAPAPAASSAARASVRATAKLSVGRLRSTGVVARLACPADCTYTVTLEVVNREARRLGLTYSTRGAAVLARSGRAPAALDGGASVRLPLKASKTAAKRMRYWLKRRGKAATRATVRVVVDQGGSRRTLRRSVRVTR